MKVGEREEAKAGRKEQFLCGVLCFKSDRKVLGVFMIIKLWSYLNLPDTFKCQSPYPSPLFPSLP